MNPYRASLALPIALVAATVVSGCGAASPAREPSASAAPDAVAPQQQYPQQSVPPAGQPGMPAPTAAPTGAQSTPERSARIRTFFVEGVALEQAGADCKAACRALGAMDRAAGELCEIDGRDGICKSAEDRVRDARGRVRNACGTCPDGVVLEPTAPIPSRR